MHDKNFSNFESVEKIANYRVVSLIDRGSIGSVYKCFDESNGTIVAVKRIETKQSRQRLLDNEIKLFQQLAHHNIVKFINVIEDSQSVNLVLEYMENGSLASNLKHLKSFSENLVKKFTFDVLNGLHYLHSNNIIHRDVKGANILLDKNGKAKVADFGVAKLIKNEGGEIFSQNSFVGTPYWIAPEIIQSENTIINFTSDIWSLGCTIIECLTGSPPYADLHHCNAIFRIVDDLHPELPSNISPKLCSFLKNCFKKNPADRPSALKLLHDPWFEDIVPSPQFLSKAVRSIEPQIQIISSHEGKIHESLTELPLNVKRISEIMHMLRKESKESEEFNKYFSLLLNVENYVDDHQKVRLELAECILQITNDSNVVRKFSSNIICELLMFFSEQVKFNELLITYKTLQSVEKLALCVRDDAKKFINFDILSLSMLRCFEFEENLFNISSLTQQHLKNVSLCLSILNYSLEKEAMTQICFLKLLKKHVIQTVLLWLAFDLSAKLKIVIDIKAIDFLSKIFDRLVKTCDLQIAGKHFSNNYILKVLVKNFSLNKEDVCFLKSFYNFSSLLLQNKLIQENSFFLPLVEEIIGALASRKPYIKEIVTLLIFEFYSCCYLKDGAEILSMLSIANGTKKFSKIFFDIESPKAKIKALTIIFELSKLESQSVEKIAFSLNLKHFFRELNTYSEEIYFPDKLINFINSNRLVFQQINSPEVNKLLQLSLYN